MPEYLAPGVYIEEGSSGVGPIEGVGTSTTGFVGGTERGPLDPRLVSSFAEFQCLYGGLVDPLANSYLPFGVKGFFENGGRRAFVVRAFQPETGGNTDAASGALDTVASVSLQLEALGPGDWGERMVAWVDNSGTPIGQNGQTESFKLLLAYFGPDSEVDPAQASLVMDEILDQATYVEQFDKVTPDPASPDSVLTKLTAGSNLVRGRWIDAAGAATMETARPNNTGAGVRLTGGSAHTRVERDAIVGQPFRDETHPATGLHALTDLDEVAILCVPDQVDWDVAGPIVEQCERLKDRFAVLNGSAGWCEPKDFKNFLGQSSHAAVYHPWIRVYDVLIRDTRLVPPSGHVAGVYARVDTERGVHKAPANQILRGLHLRDVGNKRALAQTVSGAEHKRFNSDNINIIRDFRSAGRGIRIYGARTLTDNPEWLYLSVRRLSIFVEESIEKGTHWVVFEPNHEPTWAAVRRSITRFLSDIWRSGALVGQTPAEAFFVKCDRATMTQADIDAGRLICLIGIAPVKPAEFVIFRISQKTVEASS